MSVVAALFSGISGITSNGDALSVAGDNIANISTPAFKSAAAVFDSALVQQTGNAQIGLGSRLAATTANFSQGSMANTSRATDLGIQGSGFFVVNSSNGTPFYTRAGAFQKNTESELITSSGGYTLQGYSIDETGTDSGALSNVNLTAVNSAPSATTRVNYSLNLDASAASPAAFDGTSFTNAAATSNFSVTSNVYDSLGNLRTLVTYFRKEASNQWSYHVLTAGSNLENYSGVASGAAVLDDGLMTFNSDGSLASVSAVSNYSTLDANATASTGLIAGELIDPTRNPGGSIYWAGGAAAEAGMTYDFGQVADSTSVSTQYSSANSVQSTSQDGRATGTLQSIAVEATGRISGTFSNGVTRDIYKLPIALFANEEGLTRAGNNLYAASSASGVATLSDAQTGGRGDVRSFQLEQSNTDLAGEFVKIITYQRAFQASSRTVQVAAELLQDLVQLGR